VKPRPTICCTSSNAVEVVASIPRPRGAVLPDQFLGAHVRRITAARTCTCGGECHVHAGINGDELADQARRPPEAEQYVHPECGCATSALYLAGEVRFPRTGSDPVHGGMLDAARETTRARCWSPPRSGCCTNCAAPHRKSTSARQRPGVVQYMKMITPAALRDGLVEAPTWSTSTPTSPPSPRQREADDRDRPPGGANDRVRPARLLGSRRRRRVVIGTGVAGLVAALAAHRAAGKWWCEQASDTATFYAQGGSPSCCRTTKTSIEAHVATPWFAGAGLCDPDAVRSIVADGYRAVCELVDDGARFDEERPPLALTREGGHTRRRIIHAVATQRSEVQRASMTPRRGWTSAVTTSRSSCSMPMVR